MHASAIRRPMAGTQSSPRARFRVPYPQLVCRVQAPSSSDQAILLRPSASSISIGSTHRPPQHSDCWPCSTAIYAATLLTTRACACTQPRLREALFGASNVLSSGRLGGRSKKRDAAHTVVALLRHVEQPTLGVKRKKQQAVGRVLVRRNGRKQVGCRRGRGCRRRRRCSSSSRCRRLLRWLRRSGRCRLLLRGFVYLHGLRRGCLRRCLRRCFRRSLLRRNGSCLCRRIRG